MHIPLTLSREHTATMDDTPMFAVFQRKKRSAYVRETAMPARRLGKHPNAKVYMYRRVIFVVAIVLTLAFVAKVILSFSVLNIFLLNCLEMCTIQKYKSMIYWLNS